MADLDRYKQFGQMARDLNGETTSPKGEKEETPLIKADKKKRVSDEGLLIQHEGYRRNPYVDTEGYLTGGIGHKFTEEDYKNFKPEWSDKQKDAYWAERFEEDLYKAKRQAVGLMLQRDIPEDPAVAGVITNMIFNLGYAGTKSFNNFLNALANRDIDTAIEEMKTGKNGGVSKWYSQVPERVDNLAERLSEAFRT